MSVRRTRLKKVMACFREIRNLLLESFDGGDLSKDDCLLLYDANTSKHLDFPYDCYVGCCGKFNLDEMDDSECLAEFRFHKSDIPVLFDALQLSQGGSEVRVFAHGGIPFGSWLQYVHPLVHVTETASSLQLRRQGTTAQAFVSLQRFSSSAGRVLQNVSLERKEKREQTRGTLGERALGKLQGLVPSHSAFRQRFGSGVLVEFCVPRLSYHKCCSNSLLFP
ncbi:hypothetical protein ACROYT_G035813 [Oculina patagonica]